eukprot:TRINITY_DN20585_c0_g2_i1.p1 TRINITY_DN20585_c0_g2~~TRINITY_DN20585_c0_g2_i1.p1  ORF type:complete len:260 (+),score=62.04 TRINITY_DN20585_c0_g2_i1:3-782(+)
MVGVRELQMGFGVAAMLCVWGMIAYSNDVWPGEEGGVATKATDTERKGLKEMARGEVRLHYPNLTSTQEYGQMKLIRLYWLMVDFMDFLDVPNWLDYGTLIGQWRDDRLFLADRDIDISVLDKEWHRLDEEPTRAWLASRGCKFQDTSYRHKGRKKGVVNCKWFNRTPRQGADVYGWAANDTHIFPPTREMCKQGRDNMSLPCGVCPVPIGWIFPLNCNQTLHLKQVCIPYQTQRHLKRLYGSLQTGAKCDKRRCCVDR